MLGELTPERRRRLARDLQQYLRDHLDTDPGELGAELLLQRAADLLGPVYYKRAIDDARAEARKAAAVLERELTGLEKESAGR